MRGSCQAESRSGHSSSSVRPLGQRPNTGVLEARLPKCRTIAAASSAYDRHPGGAAPAARPSLCGESSTRCVRPARRRVAPIAAQVPAALRAASIGGLDGRASRDVESQGEAP